MSQVQTVHGYYEPSLELMKLPRCANPFCPDPVHPLARSGSFDAAICPGCGGPASEPCEEQTAKATYIGEPQ